MLKLRYGNTDPRDAGVGNIVNCGAAMYIAPVGIANAGDPRGAYAEALDLTAAHQSSYGREAAGVLAACVAEALRPEATVDRVVETCLRLAKDGTRAAIEAVVETAAGLDGWRAGGLEQLRRRVRAVRLGRRRLRGARPERAHPSRLHSIEELPVALGLLVATGGDYVETVLGGVNYGRDSDSIASMGGALAGALGESRASARLGRGGIGREPDRHRGSRPHDGRRRGRDLRQGRAPARERAQALADLTAGEVPLEGDLGSAGGPGRSRAPAGPRGREGGRRARGALVRRRRRARRRPRRLAGAGRAGAAGACARPARRARGASSAARGRRAGRTGRDPRSGRSRFPAARADGRRRPDRRRLAGPGGGLRPREARRGHSSRGDPRARRGDGELARRRLVHGAGPPGRGLGTLAVEPGEPSDEPRREHQRHSRGRRPQLHDARRRAARAVRRRLRFARRRQALARLPAPRPDLHRRARCRAEPARGVPSTRDRDAPEPVPRMDRRASARGCLRVGGGRRSCGRGEDGVGGRARQPCRQRVYAAMFMAAAHAMSMSASSRPRAPTPVSRSCRRAAGSPRRCGRRETSRASRVGGASWTSSTSATGTTTGCTRSTTPPPSPPPSTPSTGTSRERSGRSSRAGWDTDTNGAAVGSILGATVGLDGIDERWAAPLGGRFASSLPGFDGITLDELVRRTLAVAGVPPRHDASRSSKPRDPWSPRPIDLPTRGAARGGRRLERARHRQDLRRPRRSRPSGRRGARRSPAGAPRRPRGSRTTAAPTTLPSFAWTRRCFSVALVWLWDELLYDHDGRALHARPVLRRGRARVRRLRRRRALARLPGDRDRRAQSVRPLPGRARHPRARGRVPASAASASSSTTTRGTSARDASRSTTTRRSPSWCATSGPTACSSTR